MGGGTYILYFLYICFFFCWGGVYTSRPAWLAPHRLLLLLPICGYINRHYSHTYNSGFINHKIPYSNYKWLNHHYVLAYRLQLLAYRLQLLAYLQLHYLRFYQPHYIHAYLQATQGLPVAIVGLHARRMSSVYEIPDNPVFILIVF